MIFEPVFSKYQFRFQKGHSAQNWPFVFYFYLVLWNAIGDFITFFLFIRLCMEFNTFFAFIKLSFSEIFLFGLQKLHQTLEN